MKKRKLSILILILMLSLTLFSCKTEISSNGDSTVVKYTKIQDMNKLNTYDIKVELNTTDMTYNGEQNVTYLNKSEDDLDNIYFHIYPNAFKSLEDAPILFDVGETINKSDYVGGYIDIEEIKLGATSLDWTVEGDKNTILKVNLPKTLKSEEKIELYLEYNVKLPSTKDRFGYHDNGVNFGNWYPIVSVYDEDGWHLDPYYKVGDPFFSEVSNYNVEITVPKEVEVATSGKVISENIKEDNRVYNVKAENVRDFAFATSEKFVIGTRQVEDTLIKLYSITDNQDIIDMALDFGEDSIRIFNKVFGEYPYDEYKIVNTEFPSGMEYPGIVFISDDYFNETLIEVLETIIVHETAHQWWYGIIGNNPIEKPWIDEGLATYSEVIYVDDIYGEDAADFYYNQRIKYIYDLNSGFLGEDKRVDKSLDQFENWNDYSILVYSRGVGFFKGIEDKYGKESLYKILQKCYEDYKFKNISGSEFLAICEEVTGDSMDELIEEHLR